MASKTGGFVGGGNWKYEHGTAHYGRNFGVRWLKLCELSFHKTRHLRNPYNENLPVKQGTKMIMEGWSLLFYKTDMNTTVVAGISRDCQELEPSIGEQLASLLYLEPDSELMAISLAAEAKREEEKAKGVNPENATENPDIVPFEDNEEEEEEESEEDEDSFEQGFGMRGPRPMGMRGFPPHMPMVRGPRPMPGMRGFPPMMNMMGNDGFSYGVGPDGFPVPDLMNMGPRAFGPFGPRFSGDFQRPPFNNMCFHAAPGPPPTGNFPGDEAPATFLTSSSSIHYRLLPRITWLASKRDQPSGGGSQTMGQDRPDDETQPGGENTFKNGESESEDEAPRRSRHGEGKKKRRSLEGDAATTSDDKT
ncbi:30-kDa cleavage and polyadenylation specificity factor 30 [Tanacetum coccineum]